MGSAGLSSDEVIDHLIRKHISTLAQAPYISQSDLPFFVADTNRIVEQHRRWTHTMPDIQPFYGQLGVNFDCASLDEIQQILSLGIDPSRIIFAHPCKAASALHFASKRGVRWTTFDNIDELEKIREHGAQMELLLRIFAQDDGAKVCLGDKFGAAWDDTWSLLERARQLDLKIVGVSFHIGSGASDPQAFATAIQQAKQVIEQGERLGFQMTVLDVGGGFQDANFEIMASGLRPALAQEFRDRKLTVIAEPGRFYATPFYTMACRVIARRTQIRSASKVADMLYQNDGLYGCFSCGWSENEVYTPVLVSGGAVERDWGEHRYSVWGPTCDSIDRVAEEVAMDCEVKIGDWLIYRNMGGEFVFLCESGNEANQCSVYGLRGVPF
ncbi:hypothetical protein EYZ11_003930 [Aspergillus tanneri]|uniref:Orn/DAP/Arg decarboxylase 2 N-terminal domain-containing protein n=1 Tax=Aspergillus tanneri TaxID=1220188 RepID=A0A4S3JME4_9EURO|nr:hypothetical protein EYZ11_003930 [Aspergillus tanneri]